MSEDLGFDEDKEDYDEESMGDDRSEYVLSEATSELDMETVSTSETLVESLTVPPCRFLTLLPRELRDKVCILSVNSFVRVQALRPCKNI